MKFAILAPGNIAHEMAKAVTGIPQIERYAVASRDLKRAEKFAAQWEFEKSYGSYEEMLRDPEAELVYVASPHSHHYEHARMCLDYGKHVLVEKAFTVNAQQAEELVRLSENKGLLLAEAIWTRYMPGREILNGIIAEGAIGNVSSLTANLGYMMKNIERLENPELAGGALLDVGVYPINFALMVFGEQVKNIHTSAVLSPRGVDWLNSITLEFEDGKMAVLHSTMLARTNRRGIIYGDKGYIEVENINNCEEIRVYDLNGNLIHTYPVPEQINGYEYEVIACLEAIRQEKVECDAMPHRETIRVMKIMDSIRRQWGMRFPME